MGQFVEEVEAKGAGGELDAVAAPAAEFPLPPSGRPNAAAANAARRSRRADVSVADASRYRFSTAAASPSQESNSASPPASRMASSRSVITPHTSARCCPYSTGDQVDGAGRRSARAGRASWPCRPQETRWPGEPRAGVGVGIEAALGARCPHGPGPVLVVRVAAP
ncbi:hypothetical protein G7085_14140 [Tessaracoccus sp. HDW20]|uniref:hypothetical protein n=1 Tax=Tessaracoccus coleopterorum TaxID=2714950 RepID=UPI0018D2EC7B|nr:hypothetical protein [Tessaracoccus coleopterorum]NHB85376.1 hypothetical protein [Tessaracoccus coleopterorum]